MLSVVSGCIGSFESPGVATLHFAWVLWSVVPPPKIRLPASEEPPGGACNRVEDLSVITFPQFWLLPEAKRLLEIGLSETTELPPKIRLPMEDFPPGGACNRVEERSEITLPQFWLALEAKALLEKFIFEEIGA